MKRLLIIFQILLGVGLLGFLVYRFFFQSFPPLVHDPSSWNAWNGFYAISYPGLSKEEESNTIYRKRFEDHLTALKEAGFNTIAPEDIAAFYRDGRPLPPKGLLILFEGGRKDSFLLATPSLKKNGFLATMAVPTAFVESWGSFYLKKSDLKKMAQSPYWRLASMGHQAYQKISIDAKGTQGHFLTNRLFSNLGHENEQRFRERVSQDYKQAADRLTQVNGKPVPAYLYPFADAGLGPQADPLASSVNRTALVSFHTLAFVSGNNPFNGADKDSLQLSRLRVSPAWTGKDLVQELEKSSPRMTPISELKDPKVWESNRPLSIKDQILILTPGTDLWVRGTEDWGDQEVEVRLSPSKGASTTFFLRYGGKRSFLMMTLLPQGVIFQEQNGEQLQTLARNPLVFESGRVHRLRIQIKANRAWLWADDALIFGGTPLSEQVARGKIGLMAGKSEIQVLDFKARQLPGYYVFSDRFEELPLSLQPETKAILLNRREAGLSGFPDEKRQRDTLIAAAAGVQTIPIIRMPEGLSAQDREKFVLQTRMSLNHPLIKPFIKTLALSGADQGWIELFHRRGFLIIELVNPATAERFISEKRKFAGDLVLIDGPEKETRKVLERLLFFVPARRIIVSLDPTSTRPQGTAAALHIKTERGGE